MDYKSSQLNKSNDNYVENDFIEVRIVNTIYRVNIHYNNDSTESLMEQYLRFLDFYKGNGNGCN